MGLYRSRLSRTLRVAGLVGLSGAIAPACGDGDDDGRRASKAGSENKAGADPNAGTDAAAGDSGAPEGGGRGGTTTTTGGHAAGGASGRGGSSPGAPGSAASGRGSEGGAGGADGGSGVTAGQAGAETTGEGGVPAGHEGGDAGGGSGNDAGSSGTCNEGANLSCIPFEGATGVCEGGVCWTLEGPAEYSGILHELPTVAIAPEDWSVPGGGTLAQWLNNNPDFPPPELTANPDETLPDRFSNMQGTIDANSIVTRMQACFQYLANDSNWTFQAGTEADEPRQEGLAYVWGSSRNPAGASGKISPGSRGRGRDFAGGCCNERLHGLDCSGLVVFCARTAGVHVPPSTVTQLASPTRWPTLTGVKVVTVPIDATAESYETGDIVFWQTHMGFIHRDPTTGQTEVLQSNGRTGCGDGQLVQSDCARNYWPNSVCSSGRRCTGPRPVLWDPINASCPTGCWNLGVLRQTLRFINETEQAFVTVNGSAAQAGIIAVEQGPVTGQQGPAELLPVTCATSGGNRTCETTFDTEHHITLVAEVPLGSGVTFAGWSGPELECRSAGTNPSVTFSRRLKKIACTATFACPVGTVWDGSSACREDSLLTLQVASSCDHYDLDITLQTTAGTFGPTRSPLQFTVPWGSQVVADFHLRNPASWGYYLLHAGAIDEGLSLAEINGRFDAATNVSESMTFHATGRVIEMRVGCY
jgi:hypothetical protein